MRWGGIAIALAVGWISGCAAHHGADGDAGAADADSTDAGTDARWVFPDTGPPPDLTSECTRSEDTVTGHAMTPTGPIEGRQAWLWTYQAWGDVGPDRLVIASATVVGPDLDGRPGALGLHAPTPAQLLARVQVEDDGALTATLEVTGPDGEPLFAEGAALTFENERFDGREPIRGTLRLSAPGWDVDLAFEMPICGYLHKSCLC